jgi:D-alanyl-lipoteichoic acid acyltransferase DltB (MBOAT superfamily)
MLFSSADYPLFLVAVFLLYALVGAGARPTRPAEAARIALALALGDVIYLLLCKRSERLWDPLGPALTALLGASSWRALLVPAAWLRFGLGLATFAGSLTLGRRYALHLDGDRAQDVIARVVTAALVALGALVLVAHRLGALERVSEVIAAHGHLGWLALLGLAVGASQHVGAGEGRATAKRLVLFAASAVFYHAWAASMTGAYRYLLALILGTIALDYWLGRWISDTPAHRPAARRSLVALSLVANLGVLVLFKYYDFFARNVVAAGDLVGVAVPLSPVALILPAGISFHTFQSLSYTLDVGSRGLRPTRSILRFATFVLFFPQLVAGPIVRAEAFLPQLDARAAPGLRGVGDSVAAGGLLRVALGLAKKLCVADMLAVTLVDAVFAHPSRYSGLECLAAVYGYALQIYFDFSAYSDIAIGSAALLGFELPENFHRPYAAASLQDFWRRWHVTLSTWLRDYVYIPLGGSRGSELATWRNLLATMLLGGLWHGAAWTFIAWGALHGLGLVAARALGLDAATTSGWRRAVATLATFHYVCLAWVFFRATSFANARELLAQIAEHTTDAGNLHRSFVAAMALGVGSLCVPLRAWELARARFVALPPWARAAVLTAAALGLREVARPTVVPFIYFQF